MPGSAMLDILACSLANCNLRMLGILTTLPFWACAKDVTILYTNDLHAHVEPYKVPWIADGKRDIGGWANITTLVKEEKIQK